MADPLAAARISHGFRQPIEREYHNRVNAEGMREIKRVGAIAPDFEKLPDPPP